MSDSPTDDKVTAGSPGTQPQAGGSQPSAPAASETGAPNEGASTAASSPAAEKTNDDKGPASIADAVRSALQKDGGKRASSSSADGSEEGEPGAASDPNKPKTGEGEEEQDLGDPTEEELNSYKPKTRSRFKALQRRTVALQEEIEQRYKPAEAQLGKINGFIANAGLSREDVNTGFEVMRLMKNDPEKALVALEPIITSLRAVVGDTLPPDLQKQVDTGILTEQHAKELSRTRSSLALTRAREERTEQQRTEQDNARAVQGLAEKVGGAVGNWETQWKSQDPDYRVKQSRVMQGIELALYKAQQTNSLPRTTAEAIAMCDKVKREVEEDMRKLKPKREAVNNPTHNGGASTGSSTTGSKPAPNSIFEAIAQAVGH